MAPGAGDTEAALARWLNGVPDDKRATLIPPGWFDAWADATFATDPGGAALEPPMLRAPNGVVADSRAYWSRGQADLGPGEDHRARSCWCRRNGTTTPPPYMSQALLPLLTHAPWKQYTLLGEGTHTIIMEKNRLQLFQVVQAFLDEPGR